MKRIVCIPIYKLRRPELINALSKSKYEVYVFTSNDDDNDYSELFKNENTNEIKTSCKNITEKRQYILDWCRNNDIYQFIMFDDDVNPSFMKITPETKRQNSESYRTLPVTPDEMMDKLFNTMTELDAGFASIMRSFYIGFSSPGRISVNSSLNFGQIVCVDVEKTKGINYPKDTDLCEDVCFGMNCLQNGVKCITVGDYSYTMLSSKESTVREDKLKFSYVQARTATLYHFNVYMDVNENIRFLIKWKKYGNNTIPEPSDEFNKNVYEMMNNNVDFKEVYDYVYNNKRKLKTKRKKKNEKTE